MEIIEKTYGKQLVPTDAANVLCDGYSKGRLITVPASADTSVWVEMTEDEADALIAANSGEDEAEATEADYQSALNELGVTFDEEV